MKSTIRSTAELARVLGLSRWTVSRALNGHPEINEETVARIKAEAQKHGFAPSMLGRALRSGQTDQVGICLPDLVDYFLTTKITLLQAAFQKGGLHPVLQIIDGSRESEIAALERFAAMRCAGVVVIASQLRSVEDGWRSLVNAGIPVVRIDPLDPAGRPSVSTDRRFAMREALKHLHELGHRRLVVTGVSPSSSYGRQRMSGLREGCRACGWDFEKDILVLPPPEAEDDFSAGALLAEDFLKLARGYHAILAINDRVALGLMRTLQARGVSIPGEVSIIGYDNMEFSPYANPPLTTIDPQVDLLIAQAVRLMGARAGVEEGAEEKLLVKPRLVRRASDGPPPVA